MCSMPGQLGGISKGMITLINLWGTDTDVHQNEAPANRETERKLVEYSSQLRDVHLTSHLT